MELENMTEITFQDTTVYKEALEEGKLKGATRLVIRLLTKLLGQEPSEEIRARISHMPLSTVENLALALFDFTSLADLEAWLKLNN